MVFCSYGCSNGLRPLSASLPCDSLHMKVPCVWRNAKFGWHVVLDRGPYGKAPVGVMRRYWFKTYGYLEIQNKVPVEPEDPSIPVVPVLILARLPRSCFLAGLSGGTLEDAKLLALHLPEHPKNNQSKNNSEATLQESTPGQRVWKDPQELFQRLYEADFEALPVMPPTDPPPSSPDSTESTISETPTEDGSPTEAGSPTEEGVILPIEVCSSPSPCDME